MDLLCPIGSYWLKSRQQNDRNINTLFSLPASVPSWYTGRLWLMRLGYYKLNRPKEQADDWVWIIDHTIQLSSEKCLVILGIRLCNLPTHRALNFADVEPIELIPVTKSSGEIIQRNLKWPQKKRGFLGKSLQITVLI